MGDCEPFWKGRGVFLNAIEVCLVEAVAPVLTTDLAIVMDPKSKQRNLMLQVFLTLTGILSPTNDFSERAQDRKMKPVSVACIVLQPHFTAFCTMWFYACVSAALRRVFCHILFFFL